MDLKEIDWQTLYLSGRGRIGRAEFWIGAAGLICVGLVAGLIPVVGVLASLALIYPWASSLDTRPQTATEPVCRVTGSAPAGA